MRDLFDIFTDENRYSHVRGHHRHNAIAIEDIDDNDTATIDELETIDDDISDFLDTSTDDADDGDE